MYNFSKIKIIKQLEMLFLIRETELLIAKKAKEKIIKTPIHLAIGQEAIAVGINQNLRKTDYIYGNHRSHSHYLASGGSLYELFSEIMGKSTGCSAGKGGSMHITSLKNGFVGSMPIVAGTVPIAVGSALALKTNGRDDIAVSYFGDGATEEGVFHESLNIASSLSLPILFVCENNLFSSHLHLSERQPDISLKRFAVANNIVHTQVDGNIVEDIEQESKELISRIRKLRAPAFIEALTYRQVGHVGFEIDEEIGLNRKVDLQKWALKDPIKYTTSKLIESNLLSQVQVEEKMKLISTFVIQCWDEALKSPFPKDGDLLSNVYFEEIS